VLVVSGTTDYQRAGHYTFFGFGLMGAWLLALNRSARRPGVWPSHLIQLGLVGGGLMSVGLLGGFGIVLGLNVYDTPQWFVALEGLGFVGWGILFPIWCVWLGRLSLSGTSSRDRQQHGVIAREGAVTSPSP
jgi:hypothetical protein